MSREFCDYVIDALAPWDEVEARRMFSGFGLYCRGIPFALIIADTLYFKVDDQNRPDYERAGSHPFTYDAKGRTVTVSHRVVPSEILDDSDLLAQWADKALAAAVRSKAGSKSKKRKI
jgi:DNA transformation protein and related proteins